ncbi:MAG: hypothetical protein ABI593_13255 [Betaproteobacteria bacterium]
MDELVVHMFSQAGTPPGCRFDELVLLIEDYEARRNGYRVLVRKPSAAAAPSSCVVDYDGSVQRRRGHG